jgi:hypothetical protein
LMRVPWPTSRCRTEMTFDFTRDISLIYQSRKMAGNAMENDPEEWIMLKL